MKDYDYYCSPERTLSELAAEVTGDRSLKARNIHNARIREILSLTGWDDRLVREELFDFAKSCASGPNLKDPAKALTKRFNAILASLRKGRT